jgi:hypothetical protein
MLPINGDRGIIGVPTLLSYNVVVAVLFSRSRFHSYRVVGIGSLRSNLLPGASSVNPPKFEAFLLHAEFLVSFISSISTIRVLPGSAPSTWMGPVRGFKLLYCVSGYNNVSGQNT